MVRKLKLKGHVITTLGMLPSTSTAEPDICDYCGDLYNDGSRIKCFFSCCPLSTRCVKCAQVTVKNKCPVFLGALKKLRRKRRLTEAKTYIAPPRPKRSSPTFNPDEGLFKKPAPPPPLRRRRPRRRVTVVKVKQEVKKEVVEEPMKPVSNLDEYRSLIMVELFKKELLGTLR